MVEPGCIGKEEWEWGAGVSPGCSVTFVSSLSGHLTAPAHLLSLQGEFDKDLL